MKDEEVIAFAKRFPKFRFLTWLDAKHETQKLLQDTDVLIFGIEEIKGLEYQEVSFIYYFYED